MYCRCPSAYSVSKASELLPDPLGPVTTTSRSRECRDRRSADCVPAPANADTFHGGGLSFRRHPVHASDGRGDLPIIKLFSVTRPTPQVKERVRSGRVGGLAILLAKCQGCVILSAGEESSPHRHFHQDSSLRLRMTDSPGFLPRPGGTSEEQPHREVLDKPGGASHRSTHRTPPIPDPCLS